MTLPGPRALRIGALTRLGLRADGGPPTPEQLAGAMRFKQEIYAAMKAEQAKRRGCRGREAFAGAVLGGVAVLTAASRRRRRAVTPET